MHCSPTATTTTRGVTTTGNRDTHTNINAPIHRHYRWTGKGRKRCFNCLQKAAAIKQTSALGSVSVSVSGCGCVCECSCGKQKSHECFNAFDVSILQVVSSYPASLFLCLRLFPRSLCFGTFSSGLIMKMIWKKVIN